MTKYLFMSNYFLIMNLKVVYFKSPFSVFFIEKANCNGKAVDEFFTEKDPCGVCGGQGRSCTDCAGVLKGRKY